ncbi:MAG: hypothetical protein V1827_01570 [Candidatus Micrarchaeota archaeon]
MKPALFIVLLFCTSAAQFEEFDASILACEERCCISENGTWDGADCTLGGSAGGAAWNSYYGCALGCQEEAGGEIGDAGFYSGNICCAPGFILAFIALVLSNSVWKAIR